MPSSASSTNAERHLVLHLQIAECHLVLPLQMQNAI